MGALDGILAEFDSEVPVTRRALERVPEGKFDWKPHPRSMSLGELAGHLATIPARIASMALRDRFDVTQRTPPAAPASSRDLLETFDRSVAEARSSLASLDEKKALETWHLLRAGKELLAIPRIAVVRKILLNHWYHHRGQLAVYLRLLDIPVPSIYGASADENPFP